MNDWQRFFDQYAPKYNDECFTKNTDAEVPFIVEQLTPAAGAPILDVGCGTGRHSIGLARLGYQVTGIDLSQAMLDIARSDAEQAGVQVDWVHTNATDFIRSEAYDAAICLCEGAMCLLTDADDPYERDMTILRNVHQSLKPGGRLLLNVLNGCRQIRQYSDGDVDSGRFDVLTLAERSDVEGLFADEGSPLHVCERGYTAPEIQRMLIWTGFEAVGIYGGTAGAWNLQRPKLDEMELMVIATKRQ